MTQLETLDGLIFDVAVDLRRSHRLHKGFELRDAGHGRGRRSVVREVMHRLFVLGRVGGFRDRPAHGARLDWEAEASGPSDEHNPSIHDPVAAFFAE